MVGINKALLDVVNAEDIHDGHLKVGRITFKNRKFDGGWTPEIERTVTSYSNGAAVLPYDPNTGNVLLIEQFRLGAAIAGDAMQLEIVAGGIDGRELGEQAARREAKEEAGITIDDVEYITQVYSVAGGSPDKLYLYLAPTDLSNAGGVHGLDKEHEDIKVHVMSLEEAMVKVSDGTIQQPAAIIALMWLDKRQK